jgi:hypothetical protein
MKTTTQKLAMTAFDYEMMIFSFYSRWCESNSGNTRQYQQLLANSAVNAWFLLELSKCELEFHKATDRYVDTVTSYDMQVCYNDMTFKLFNIRPTALLEGFKILRSQGIKVFNGLNQN